MRRTVLAASLLVAGCARPAAQVEPVEASRPAPTPSPVLPAGNPAVGGVVLPTDQPIADTLAAAPSLSTLTRLLAAAGMADTLRAPGPLTLFAPTDVAFGRLQPGTLEALTKPENRVALQRLIGLHLVAERLGGDELRARVQAGGGRATLTSVAGEPLTATLTAGIFTLTDAGGNKSYVEVADVRGANGVVHVVNGVLVPRLN